MQDVDDDDNSRGQEKEEDGKAEEPADQSQEQDLEGDGLLKKAMWAGQTTEDSTEVHERWRWGLLTG